ncbi:MAG: hypothetical protein JWQ29_1738 [Phenylobacterium sp.]|nr:hypothetical protein [Phenylobacterium sp.]
MQLRTVTRAAAIAAAGALGALFATPSMAALSCNQASIQSAVPADTTITSAVSVAKPVPNCKIDGYVTTTNPGPNKAMFRLQLPDKGFAGRYYFVGLGGSAGYVPTDSQIPGGNPLVKGFAVAGTDTGREGSGGDWDFLGTNKAQAVDHVHRAAHVTAQVTQKITRDYYDWQKIYRYHSGCSGGGRMGMMAITRHPEDYDGVLLGAPGGRSSGTMLKFIHAGQQMSVPGAWISPAKFEMIDKKVTAACDATDGAVDGVVWDHRLCHFDVATLRCPSGDGPDCLTDPQIKALKAILAGVRGPDGKLLAEPMPIVNMSTWSQFLGQNPPPWISKPTSPADMAKIAAGPMIGASLARAYFGPDYDAMKFDFKDQKQIDAWWAAAARVDYGQPYTANLKGLQNSGGKVLFWNGRADLCCSDIELQNYYLEASKIAGGDPAARKFMALYQVPGMGHCGSGTGPQDAPDQLLEQLVNWVEKGQQPGPVVTHRGADRVKLMFADPASNTVSGVVVPNPAGGPRDFLLCRYPQYSAYSGKGSVNEAANWSCKTPKPGDKRQG